MLRYTIIFFIIALVAGVLGFTGLSGTMALVAQLCFGLFLIMALVSLLARTPIKE